MISVVLKGVRAHKRRVVSTFLAVFIGVAFLVGVQVLGDTVSQKFVSLFTDVFNGTDAQVRSSQKVEAGGNTVRGPIDDSLLSQVEAVDGVKSAEVGVFGFGQLFQTNGKPVNPSQGPPTFASNWSDDPDLSHWHLLDDGSRAPQPVADGQPVEVVIDKHSSEIGHLKVGDVTKAQVNAAQVPVEVVGIAKFGSAESPGGAAFTLFSTTDAQRLVTAPGKANYISVVGEPGISQQELANRIQKAMPSGVETVTGETVKQENIDQINQFVNILKVFLTVFALIALAVGAFSIFNTFSIIVAQRTREMALLRCLGASRKQVLGAVLGEALLIGVLGFAFGLLGGVLVAAGLIGILNTQGLGVSASSLTVTPFVVIVAFLVGVGVTMLAAAAPAVRASRVPPLAAMRESVLDNVTVPRIRTVVGAVFTLVGTAGVITFALTDVDHAIVLTAVSGLLVIVGIIVLGPVVAAPVATALGRPAVAIKGVTGAIARDNVMRSPKRAARTATMLLIGVTVVTLFTVLAASINNAINEQVNKAFVGDLVINSNNQGFGGFDANLTTQLRAVPEVEVATPLRIGQATVDGHGKQIVVVDPATVQSGLNISVQQGNLTDLANPTIAVSKDRFNDDKLALGDPVPVTFLDGTSTTLPVSAVFNAKGVLNGVDYALGQQTYNPHALDKLDAQVYVTFKDGVSVEQGRAAIKPITDQYQQATVQNRQEFKDAIQAQINSFLFLVYGLLFLAIFISLLGIANTLSLSIHERTRELGLLRAVGMTKRQLRSAVRWESVILAVFGTVGGIGLGVFAGWAFVKQVERQGLATLALPIGSLVTILIVGALAGLLAAFFPARRAAKLNVLAAIASE